MTRHLIRNNWREIAGLTVLSVIMIYAMGLLACAMGG
jgi:hypothetical protein